MKRLVVNGLYQYDNHLTPGLAEVSSTLRWSGTAARTRRLRAEPESGRRFAGDGWLTGDAPAASEADGQTAVEVDDRWEACRLRCGTWHCRWVHHAAILWSVDGVGASDRQWGAEVSAL